MFSKKIQSWILHNLLHLNTQQGKEELHGATSGKENVLPKEKVALNLSKKRVAETQDVVEPQHKKVKPVNTRKQTALKNITNIYQYQSKPKNVESCNEFVVKKVTKTYSAKRTKIDKIDTNAI